MSEDYCPNCDQYRFPEHFEMEAKLAAREKRMREVAEELKKKAAWLREIATIEAQDDAQDLEAWAARLLEGIEAE